MSAPINNNRRLLDFEPLVGREHSGVVEQERAQLGSGNLRRAIQSLFTTWEQTHGFQKGAAEILLPAGYSVESESA